MKLFCILFIMSFGFVNSAYAAESLSGRGLAKIVDEGKAPLGFTKAIPCGENYEPSYGCYKWTPAESELLGHCYRASLVGLHHHYPYSVQLRFDSENLFKPSDNNIVMVNYRSETSKEVRPVSVKINENAYYPMVYGVKIDCAPSSRNKPLIFQQITSSIPLVLPASFDLKENLRSDCLLAEKVIRWGGLRSPDDTQFYCLGTETTAEAEIVVENFLEDLKNRGSEIKSDPLGPLTTGYHNSEWFIVPIIYSQGMSPGNFIAGLRVTILPPEEIVNFYSKTGIDAEIPPERTVVLFGFDVNFLKK